MSSGGVSLQPTFNGHVASTQDALLLFEACLQGHLSHVPRRPHDRERASLIRSGCVFIYEENASGIKRWTDGVTWSPSRILGNFLVYRELDKPFPPGEKKRAVKKTSRRPSGANGPYARPEPSSDGYSPTTPQSANFNNDRGASDLERQLIGSLVDSYGFKPDGLVKKTMSVTVQGVTHHLVSYYNVSDVMNNTLRMPSQTESLQYIRPRVELTQKQSFRAPLEETEDLDGVRDPNQAHYGYRLPPQGYAPGQYYMPPYSGMPHHSPTAAGYPVGAPPMPQHYLQTPAHAQMQPPRPAEYSPYDQSSYARNYDAINGGQRSMPPISAPATTPNVPNQQPVMYSQPGPQHRSSMTTLSPITADSRTAAAYGRNSYNIPPETGSLDGHRRTQPSPVHSKYDDKREPQQTQPQMYSAPRTHYPYDGTAQPTNSGHYHAPPPMPQWSAPPTAQ